MDYFLLGAAVCVIIAIISWRLKNSFKKPADIVKNKADNKNGRKKIADKEKITKNSENSPTVKCPLCETALFSGENLISKVYRPMNVPDQLMIILGCPHCYPKQESGLKRICPVCRKKVEQNQSLTARLFNKSVGKKHVHVIGCSNCRKPRAE